MSLAPTISIIIVNYNGRHLLAECLPSVFEIEYPPSLFEVLVVDNNSSDDSVTFITKYFPQVKLIRSDENLGFAGGNILGYQHATGEYIVLLNSDTRVDRNWLKELVRAAKPASVGVVNSKLFFWMPFLELTIRSSILSRSEIVGNTDFSPLGVLLEDVICDRPELKPLIWYGSGFYEKIEGEIVLRWTRDKATILLPFQENIGNNIYKITAHGYPIDKPISANLSLSIGSQEVVSDSILSHQVKEYVLNVNPDMAGEHYVWLVQNAGNIVLKDASGKDRGCVVLKKKGESIEFYEKDCDLYHQPTKLLAFCGASCLIKRHVIKKVGFFDPTYFMYYEDMDLSLRIWMAGFDIVYAPQSIVYHKHKATSKAAQDTTMLYHLEKNYLAFLCTYFPVKVIALQSLRLVLRLIFTLMQMVVYSFSDNLARYEEWRAKYQKRKQAIWYIIQNSPALLRKRYSILRHAKRQFNIQGRIFQY